MKIEVNATKGHMHTCPKCRTTWAHDPRDLCRHFAKDMDIDIDIDCNDPGDMRFVWAIDPEADAAYDRAHVCPKCGYGQVTICQFDLSVRPEFYHTGLTTVTWDEYDEAKVRMLAPHLAYLKA